MVPCTVLATLFTDLFAAWSFGPVAGSVFRSIEEGDELSAMLAIDGNPHSAAPSFRLFAAFKFDHPHPRVPLPA